MIEAFTAPRDFANRLSNYPRPPLCDRTDRVAAWVAPVNETTVLVIAEDISGTRRIEDVRRDFVANVSHELKTRLGALSLLSEAVLEAADEPDEVRHFCRSNEDRKRTPGSPCDRPVDLSRLQGDDPMQYAQEVDIDSVLHEAVDSMRTTAQARNIDITVGGDHHAKVFGVESQLVTAVRNPLANAVACSEQTRISLGCRVAPATARSPLRIRGWEFIRRTRSDLRTLLPS